MIRRAAPLLVALAAVALVLGTYLALGGASYKPTPVADPCQQRAWRNPHGTEAVLEQIALSGLDGAACKLGVSREDLVIALRSQDSLDAFAREHHISRSDAEAAVRDGLVRSVDDAVQAGALKGFLASLVRRTVETVPPGLLLDTLERLRGFVS